MLHVRLNKSVKSFISDYAPKGVSLGVLKHTAEKLGFTVVEFNHAYNDENVSSVIKALKLQDMISHSKGFTYVTSNYKLIFVHCDLPEKEKSIVLAHELGHIYLDHIKPETAMTSSVMEEFEANSFAYRLLNPTGLEKLKFAIRRHRTALTCILCALLVLIAAIIVVIFKPDSKQAQKKDASSKENVLDYYISDTGNKYHLYDCGYVNRKPEPRKITQEEYESGKYQPCSACLGELLEKSE